MMVKAGITDVTSCVGILEKSRSEYICNFLVFLVV